MLSSPLESPEGSALLGFGLGQGLPWGRSPWAGSWTGGSPPARGVGAEDRTAGEGVAVDAVEGALSDSCVAVGVSAGSAAPAQSALFGYLHAALRTETPSPQRSKC